MKIYCEEISNDAAIDFLMENKSWREFIDVKNTKNWIGAFTDGVLVGVLGFFDFKKTYRIRTVFVSKDYRRNGVYTALIEHLLGLDCFEKGQKITVFSTPNGKSVLENKGFTVVKKVKQNDDYFMEKVIK